MQKNSKADVEDVEDVKVSRRMAGKERTLQRRQARQIKDFIRNNG